MKISSVRMQLNLKRLIVSMICFIVFGVAMLRHTTRAVSAPADENPQVDSRVARIGVIDDSASFRRGDDEQWLEAAVNTPLQTGDQLFAGDHGHVEVQLDGNLLRLNSGSHFDVSDLSPEKSQFGLYSGTMTVNLRYKPTQPVEIDSPHAAVSLTEPGEYRINALDNGSVEVQVKRGHADVFDGNHSTEIRNGHRLTLNEHSSTNVTKLPASDDWDGWNEQRDHQLELSHSSRDQITESNEIAGIEDLDSNGEWSNIPEYGRAWSPSNVAEDWAPYSLGRWMWRDPFGWNWVSTERWGWAPYHYGRWTYVSNRWYWVPGTQRRYSPALVGFMSYKNGRVGWVPLAPRDRLVPWWGPSVARSSTTQAFMNQRFRNAVTATTRDGLITGRIEHDRKISLQDGRPVTRLDVIPTRASLAPSIERDRAQNVRRPNFDYSSRNLVVKRNEIPVVRSFSEKEAEIKKTGGASVSEYKRTEGGSRVTQSRSVSTKNSTYTNKGTDSSLGEKGKGNSTIGPGTNPNPPLHEKGTDTTTKNGTRNAGNKDKSSGSIGGKSAGGNNGPGSGRMNNSASNVNSVTSTSNGKGRGSSSDNSNRSVTSNTVNGNSTPKDKRVVNNSSKGNAGTSVNNGRGSTSTATNNSTTSNTDTNKKKGLIPILTGIKKNNSNSNGSSNSGRGTSSSGNSNNKSGRGTSSTGNSNRSSSSNSGNSNTKKKKP